MKYVKISDFFKRKTLKPFLLGAFLSRVMEETIEGKKYFYAYSSFKSSKVVDFGDFDFNELSKSLINKFNLRSGFDNWIVFKVTDKSMELRFYVLNDIDISKIFFYKSLFQKVMQSDWITEPDLNDKKRDFIRGFIELRGSVDTTAKLIAQDYFYDDRMELKKAQILTDFMSVPLRFANFNARNLQPDYVSGKNMRNTQFRINLYFYAKFIGFINEYKAEIFNESYYSYSKHIIDYCTYFDVEIPKGKVTTAKFIEYLNFFTDNIYEKKLTPEIVNEYRKVLGFDIENDSSPSRNKKIIEVYSNAIPDVCAICGTTKTSFNPRTGKQNFEIHHVISLNNGQIYDDIKNLVKLCPTCHDMLKKNHATKEEQMNGIRTILYGHEEVRDYVSSVLCIDDINELVEKIWEMLG